MNESMEKIWAATIPIGSAWPWLIDASVRSDEIRDLARMFRAYIKSPGTLLSSEFAMFSGGNAINWRTSTDGSAIEAAFSSVVRIS